MAPLGISFFFRSPAPFGNDVVAGGMLNTTQCQKPLPVGASGSNMVTAKLLVPAGAPLQPSAGEMSPPLQPKPFSACWWAIVAPWVISGLVKVKLCAFAAPAPEKPIPSAAIQNANLVAANLVTGDIVMAVLPIDVLLIMLAFCGCQP